MLSWKMCLDWRGSNRPVGRDLLESPSRIVHSIMRDWEKRFAARSSSPRLTFPKLAALHAARASPVSYYNLLDNAVKYSRPGGRCFCGPNRRRSSAHQRVDEGVLFRKPTCRGSRTLLSRGNALPRAWRTGLVFPSSSTSSTHGVTLEAKVIRAKAHHQRAASVDIPLHTPHLKNARRNLVLEIPFHGIVAESRFSARRERNPAVPSCGGTGYQVSSAVPLSCRHLLAFITSSFSGKVWVFRQTWRTFAFFAGGLESSTSSRGGRSTKPFRES